MRDEIPTQLTKGEIHKINAFGELEVVEYECEDPAAFYDVEIKKPQDYHIKLEIDQEKVNEAIRKIAKEKRSVGYIFDSNIDT